MKLTVAEAAGAEPLLKVTDERGLVEIDCREVRFTDGFPSFPPVPIPPSDDPMSDYVASSEMLVSAQEVGNHLEGLKGERLRLWRVYPSHGHLCARLELDGSTHQYIQFVAVHQFDLQVDLREPRFRLATSDEESALRRSPEYPLGERNPPRLLMITHRDGVCRVAASIIGLSSIRSGT